MNNSWTNTFFNRLYLELFLLKTPAINKRDFNQISPYLKGNIIDIGCGAGVLTNEITLNGYNCLGIDKTPYFIEYAQQNMKGEFICKDYHNIDYTDAFDTAICWHSSLGYGGNDQQVIDSIYNSLKPGGCFIFECPEFDLNIRDDIQHINGWTITRTSTWIKQYRFQTWKYVKDDITYEYNTRMYFYRDDELRIMFKKFQVQLIKHRKYRSLWICTKT